MYNYYVMYLIYDYFHFSKKNNNLDIFIYLVAEKQTFLNDCFSFGALSFFAYPTAKENVRLSHTQVYSRTFLPVPDNAFFISFRLLKRHRTTERCRWIC